MVEVNTSQYKNWCVELLHTDRGAGPTSITKHHPAEALLKDKNPRTQETENGAGIGQILFNTPI